MNATEVSFQPSGRVWRVTYNGRVLGDSRGYGSASEARAEALKIVNEEHARARVECRHANLVYRPG